MCRRLAHLKQGVPNKMLNINKTRARSGASWSHSPISLQVSINAGFTLIEALIVAGVLLGVVLICGYGIVQFYTQQKLLYNRSIAAPAAMLLSDWHARQSGAKARMSAENRMSLLESLAGSALIDTPPVEDLMDKAPSAPRLLNKIITSSASSWDNITTMGGDPTPTDRLYCFSQDDPHWTAQALRIMGEAPSNTLETETDCSFSIAGFRVVDGGQYPPGTTAANLSVSVAPPETSSATLIQAQRMQAYLGVLTERSITAKGTVQAMGSNAVTAVTLDSGGYGYIHEPVVTVIFKPDDQQPTTSVRPAVIRAVLHPRKSVKGVWVTNRGTGYTSAPNVTIAQPPPGGRQALAEATVCASGVATIRITDPGYGYIIPPMVTMPGSATGTSYLEIQDKYACDATAVPAFASTSVDLSAYQRLIVSVSDKSSLELDSNMFWRQVSFWYGVPADVQRAAAGSGTATVRFLGRFLMPDYYQLVP
jgi:hypothetical protein